MSISSLKTALARIANRNDFANYTDEKNDLRQAYVDAVMTRGGKDFIERVKLYATNERGEKLRLTTSYLEQLELTGDFRVPWVLTTGPAQIGKAQPLDAKILTPTGWKLMGDICVGDEVMAGDGAITKVNGVFPQGVKEIYRVTMTDGRSAECCDDHLWLTQTCIDRAKARRMEPTESSGLDLLGEAFGQPGSPCSVKTLAEIRETIIDNHALPRYQVRDKQWNLNPVIFEIESVGYKEAQCISIDHPSHLYITDDYIVTHNTLSHLLIQIDGVVCGKLNGAWFYATGRALDQMVPIQFRPAIGYWIKNMEAAGFRFRRQTDTMVNTRYQVDGANAIFTFVSTTNKKDDGMAVVGGVAASFTADYSIMEERSQYDSGSADICLDRMNNSKIPTRPRRDLGTPGGGMGIEIDMKDCHHYFKPHYLCPHCSQVLPLTPKGCLLKEFEREDILGNKIKTYLSESGRPEDNYWWCHDPIDPVRTAYVACSSCGGELSLDDRLNSKYRCISTGVWLRDFLDTFDSTIQWKIGLQMSPLVQLNPIIASMIIANGIGTDNPFNWQQQSLGYPTSTEVLVITPEQIRSLVGLPVPSGDADYRLAGIDVGRGEDWLVIIDFYLPPDRANLSIGQIIEKTVRRVIYCEAIVRTDLGDILQRYDVDYGLIDNEPSRDSAMKICDNSVLELANQANPKDTVRSTIVKDGGIEYPCWDLRNSKFMLQVFEGFHYRAWDGHICYRLPPSWVRWYENPTGRSPIRHLSGPWRDQEMVWHRGKDNLDDIYMAILFAEASFYLQLEQEYGGVQTKIGKREYR